MLSVRHPHFSFSPMVDPNERCDLCGTPAEAVNPLVPDEFYTGVNLHLHCLNSPAGNAWTQAKADADPLYARYLSLITLGYRLHCSACGSLESLSPKATGMGAGHWEASCRACHRYQPLLNAYRSPAEGRVCDALGRLARDIALSRDPAGVLRRVEHLAEEGDALLPPEPCACGGAYSLAARPRCSRCREVLIDSPFHFTLTP